jgi:hypothetical protein
MYLLYKSLPIDEYQAMVTLWVQAKTRVFREILLQCHLSHHIFLIGILGGGVQSSPLGTAATKRPTVPAPGDYDDGGIGGIIGRGNLSTGRKPALVPLCPPQTPHVAWTRIRAAAVGSQRLINRLSYGTAVSPKTQHWITRDSCQSSPVPSYHISSNTYFNPQYTCFLFLHL